MDAEAFRLPIIHTTADGEVITIRLILPSDSFVEMTALLHRSYKPLADMGLRFLATHQNETVTEERAMMHALCLVAVSDERLIGTITMNYPGWTKGSAFYERPEVAHFGQFAVLPEYQKYGLGTLLLTASEALARVIGASEIALDTSEDAHHLLRYYENRGYRFVEYVQWDEVNYRSKTLSKRLVE